MVEITDEQMCEAVVDGLAFEPYESNGAVVVWDEYSTFSEKDFDNIVKEVLQRQQAVADRRRRELEQQLAEKQALIDSLEAKIAALEHAQMCEAVVEGLADDAHNQGPLTQAQADRYRFWTTQKYDGTAFKRMLRSAFPAQKAFLTS